METYNFGPNEEYRMLVAADCQARERAFGLVYGVYLANGLTDPRASRMQVSCHDALPGTTSLLVERCGGPGDGPVAVASLTLIPDSPLGLPLDAIARGALDALRNAGRRPVELAKLATVAATEKHESGRPAPREEILLHLFKLAYLIARRLEEATDLVIAVAPHQERYFRRILLFDALEDAPADPSAAKPLAVPLRLRLDAAEDLYAERYLRRSRARNLYAFFVNEQEPEVLGWLSASRRQLSAEEVRWLFSERSRLLQKADEATRRLILSLYPGLEVPAAKPRA